MKKISVTLIALVLIFQFSSFAFASENNIATSKNVQNKVVRTIYQNNYTTSRYMSQKQIDSLLGNYVKFTVRNYDIADADIVYRDLTGDGVYELIILYQGFYGERYLEIYTPVGNKMVRIFSGQGGSIDIGKNSFSITNIKFDGRYFYETYTYRWRNGKFLRTGYSKTYIKNDGYFWEWPTQNNALSWSDWSNWNNTFDITKDERTLTVKNLLKARMTGELNFARNYLSKDLKSKTSSNKLCNLIPYGKVSTIDIFDSQRGDWVVAVINDNWGQSRVFKFVPVKEKDQYGNYKIDQIVEIPRAN